VPILQTASLQDRKRLLELFPLAVFREVRPDLKGTKEEVCYSFAEGASRDQVVGFVRNNLCRCKQHVYIFDTQRKPGQLPHAITGGERVFLEGDEEALYVIRTSYSVVLKDPLEETELEFLWPVLVHHTRERLVVRFVALERTLAPTLSANVTSYEKASKKRQFCGT
jgi:hypothetical protein